MIAAFSLETMKEDSGTTSLNTERKKKSLTLKFCTKWKYLYKMMAEFC